jgi:outer membrane translocation and assembly module TamA
VTPFDYFIWKDVRTSVQLAFFAETGSVEDLRSELGDTFRSSYGMGLRLISGSGFVYRLDIATGDEETETIVIFGYPF